MSLIPTWPIAAATLVVGLIAGAGVTANIKNAKIDRINADHAEESRQRELVRADDERLARAKEQQMAQEAGKVKQTHEDEIKRIRTASDDAIARLSNRPARVVTVPGTVPSATPTCKGATGADLFRDDSIVLVGIAQRADEQRAALAACYGWADAVIASSAKANDTIAKPASTANR